MAALSLTTARELDARDELRHFRERFALPEGLIYLDGNSLGALPRASIERIAQVTAQQWGCDLIGSWNRHDWLNSPVVLGRKIAKLIGAAEDDVVVTDTTSVNLFRLIMTALDLQPNRHEVLSEVGNFPTDLYVCEGATRAFGRDRGLRAVPRDQLIAAIGDDTALLVLTHVHYKSGEVHAMRELTALAQSRGALVLWDLSHSAGAVHVDLEAAHADFAVGCGYKYLNGGPGAPSFLYVAQRHHEHSRNPISGWMGHARPFEFIDGYEPASGIRRFLAGTPSIIASAALEVGVDMLLEAGIERLTAKSRQLAEYFIEAVESACAGQGLELASPRKPDERGSHVSFRHEHGYEIMQALISDSVIGDFRAPDIMRFGITPLYTRFEDVWIAGDRLGRVLRTASWREPRYAVRAAVT